MKIDEYSIVSFVDALITEAITQGASDIHLESLQNSLRIRYRIDGVLYDRYQVPAVLMVQVLSRIKVLAHIDIAERRLPHDGKFCVTYQESSIDLRVSTFPSLYGEKMVIRILDRSRNMVDIEHLGFNKEMLLLFLTLLKRATGFLLVTGPTGSGKTTTLYAALSWLQSPEKNIVTLEDPIEYNVDGITQAAVHPEIGFTFACGIRSLLRQDPDIIMVGEIRDRETAQVAIQAALTGHLVLSTVHTNDALGVVTRLIDMGVEPFLINAALTGVLAQRLARKICSFCKVVKTATNEETALIERLRLPITTLFTGTGCDACMQLGYRGRIGIFELLTLTSALRHLITEHLPYEQLYEQAVADGLQPLLFDAATKVNSGLITLQELVRVLL